MDKDLEQQLIEKKAEAWDTMVFIEARKIEFQKFIAPYEEKFRRIVGEINRQSLKPKPGEKNVKTEGDKIVVKTDSPTPKET